MANGCFVAAVNRVGHEGPVAGGIEFWGQSFVCDTSGQVLSRGNAKDEELLLAEVPLSKIEFVRTHWPFLRDRRIDAYEGLTRRYLDP